MRNSLKTVQYMITKAMKKKKERSSSNATALRTRSIFLVAFPYRAPHVALTLWRRTSLPALPFVASSGIEPESGASETLILSIVLRGR